MTTPREPCSPHAGPPMDDPEPFAARHIGTWGPAQQTMLRALGLGSLDELMQAALPAGLQPGSSADSTIPAGVGERQMVQELRGLAGQNTIRHAMIGLGYHPTTTPSVIRRNVFENPSWYTAYTPYQPEISQGRLEALLVFQTMVADLTGLAYANASLLDEATAVTEAMLLATRASHAKDAQGHRSRRFIVDEELFPQTHAVLSTRARALGIELVRMPLGPGTDLGSLGDHLGLVVQYPGASGRLWDPSTILAQTREQGGMAIVAADLLAVALVVPPGELGADVAVGTTQRFGVPMGFGGPHAAYLAVREGLQRQLPGRLVGISVDADGQPAYRLSLQTREQHIRRERATSNICTAQVLLAVMAAMFAVYHGPEGILRIAERVATQARALATALAAGGVGIVHEHFFDTVCARVPGRAHDIVGTAAAAGYLLREVDRDTVCVALDETTDAADLVAVLGAFGVAAQPVASGSGQLKGFRRAAPILQQQVFALHHSETGMMRYLRSLADKDYALDRGMIPLGSCTMKLNAAAALEAASWPAFVDLHPFAPAEDAAGTLALVAQLESWLAELTGYDTASLQPNAGSQGEVTGLLAIRGWHHSRGEDRRTVCLIPASAHGTNAASAALAGFRVVEVATDAHGDIDRDDLGAKLTRLRDEVGALMITYPSTHGVYEEEVRQVAAAAHEVGAQVYIDGANLNALVGWVRLGDLGGDVSHVNLHKTFAIPHGGGGPGVGPVVAKAHLAPFLPGHPFAQAGEHVGYRHTAGAVSAAPFGSPAVLPISWGYIRMMGVEGLRRATASAVLAANYLAARLRAHFPVLYTGRSGLVGHECILDLNPLHESTGVSVDDVAKRLIDYGFHAPTMSFPVPGTFMVEPTESEDLDELDRFVEAMVAIKGEAEAVALGEWPRDDNPLRNAPHTARAATATEWPHPYPREQAVYPSGQAQDTKYWPPVGRIDQAYGDRHLVCVCE